MITTPRVISVNVGQVKEIEWNGERVATGIIKLPVTGRIALRGVNFDGDDQEDRTVHGGPDKAVYAYAWEDYEYWRATAGIQVVAGLFGENLTVEGMDLSAAIVGEHWSVGSTVLEVAQPRLPCYKLGIRVGDSRFLGRFLRAARTGAYLRVVREGAIGSGDEVRVTFVPTHGVSLRSMLTALRDPGSARLLRAVPHLPDYWQRIAGATGMT